VDTVELLRSRLDELEKRVSALEAGSPEPRRDACPFCISGSIRVKTIKPHPIFGVMGVEERDLVCDSCGKTQTVMYDPKDVTSGSLKRR
jgi:hypothetical protein